MEADRSLCDSARAVGDERLDAALSELDTILGTCH